MSHPRHLALTFCVLPIGNMCEAFMAGQCLEGVDCRYAHTDLSTPLSLWLALLVRPPYLRVLSPVRIPGRVPKAPANILFRLIHGPPSLLPTPVHAPRNLPASAVCASGNAQSDVFGYPHSPGSLHGNPRRDCPTRRYTYRPTKLDNLTGLPAE